MTTAMLLPPGYLFPDLYGDNDGDNDNSGGLHIQSYKDFMYWLRMRRLIICKGFPERYNDWSEAQMEAERDIWSRLRGGELV